MVERTGCRSESLEDRIQVTSANRSSQGRWPDLPPRRSRVSRIVFGSLLAVTIWTSGAEDAVARQEARELVPRAVAPSPLLVEAMKAEWLTPEERSDMRLRHGTWGSEDLQSKPASKAAAAMMPADGASCTYDPAGLDKILDMIEAEHEEDGVVGVSDELADLFALMDAAPKQPMHTSSFSAATVQAGSRGVDITGECWAPLIPRPDPCDPPTRPCHLCVPPLRCPTCNGRVVVSPMPLGCGKPVEVASHASRLLNRLLAVEDERAQQLLRLGVEVHSDVTEGLRV